MQEVIKKLNVDFVCSDIYKNEELGLYDNVNLSNIGQYAHSKEELINFKNLVLRLVDYLNIDGMMMVMYIFGTIRNNSNPSHDSNFVKSSMMELFEDISSEVHAFPSVKELVFDDKSSPDYAMIYRKIR